MMPYIFLKDVIEMKTKLEIKINKKCLSEYKLNENTFKIEIKDNKLIIKINYMPIKHLKISDASYNYEYYEYIRNNLIEYILSYGFKLTYESMNYKRLLNEMHFKYESGSDENEISNS